MVITRLARTHTWPGLDVLVELIPWENNVETRQTNRLQLVGILLLGFRLLLL